MNKKYRIKKNEEFSKLISYKHSLASASFIMYYHDKAFDNSRAGISVSKKLGDAVTRNRIKRQVREMLRDLIDFERCDKDIILIVRKPFLDKSFQDNKNDLENMLKKAIIYQYE